MKKIKGKKFIKKFILSMMLVVLLSSYMVPGIVLAADEIDWFQYPEDVSWLDSMNPNNFDVKTVQGIITDISILSVPFNNSGETADIKKEARETVKNIVATAIMEFSESVGGKKIDLDKAEKLCKYYKDNDKAIKIGLSEVKTCENDAQKEKLCKAYKDPEKYQVFINKAIDLNPTIAGKSIDDIKLDDIKPDYDEEDKNNDVYEKDKEKEDDGFGVGGMLLKPLFYLVNMVADSIQGLITYCMTGDFQAMGLLERKSDSELTKELTDVKANTDNASSEDVDVELKLANATEWTGIQYPNIQYTPEEVFKGEIPLLSIDFISGKMKNPKYNPNDPNSEKYIENDDSGWQQIRVTISQWYKVFRLIAIIGLLSVLIYTGIKIIISSTSREKAKYKEWIVNWFVAVALLFSMHFIMAFTISVVEELNSALSAKTSGIVARVTVVDDHGNPVPYEAENKVTYESKKFYSKNLMGIARFMIQSENAYILIAYEVIYIALIVYTFKFTIIYLKRVLNMAFLTMIAPIVAFTYPIDKINDGKAQGFDMWIKEYFFNALLQPLHYFMYYVLLSSAIGIAAKNPLYGIVVLGFMTQAEKMLKKIFGFDKASGGTVGGMAGAFAAGALASQVKNIARMGKGASGGGKDNGPQHDLRDVPGGKVEMNDYNALPSGGDNNSSSAGSGQNSGHESQQDTTNSGHELESNATGAEDIPESSDQEANQEADVENEQDEEFIPEEFNEEEEMLNANDNPEVDSSTGQLKYTYGEDNLSWDEYSEKRKAEIAESNKVKEEEFQKNKLIRDEALRIKRQKEAKKAKRDKAIRGAKAVGKRFAKPIWDFEAGADADANRRYNMKRLGKKALRAAAGFGMGVTAATVQAGISITDGKYSPMEGIASFGAGYAGAGKLAKKAESYTDTYSEAAISIDDNAKREKRKREFEVNEKVISSYKSKYGDNYRTYLKRARDSFYGDAGIKDISMQQQGLKYSDSLRAKEIAKREKSGQKLSEEEKERIQKQCDERAANVMKFREMIDSQGQSAAIFDDEKMR